MRLGGKVKQIRVSYVKQIRVCTETMFLSWFLVNQIHFIVISIYNVYTLKHDVGFQYYGAAHDTVAWNKYMMQIQDIGQYN